MNATDYVIHILNYMLKEYVSTMFYLLTARWLAFVFLTELSDNW